MTLSFKTLDGAGCISYTTFTNLHHKNKPGGWWDGSVVKHTIFSCRETQTGSLYIQAKWQMCLIPVLKVWCKPNREGGDSDYTRVSCWKKNEENTKRIQVSGKFTLEHWNKNISSWDKKRFYESKKNNNNKKHTGTSSLWDSEWQREKLTSCYLHLLTEISVSLQKATYFFHSMNSEWCWRNI